MAIRFLKRKLFDYIATTTSTTKTMSYLSFIQDTIRQSYIFAASVRNKWIIKRGILKAKAMTKIINSTYQILAWSCAFHLVYLWGMSRPYLSLTQQCAVSLPTYLSRNVSPLYLRMSIFAKSCMEKIFGQMPWWRSSGQRARLVLQRPKFESLWSLQFFCSFQNPGSNLATINFYWAFALCQLLRKDEKLRKRGQEWPIFNYLS